MIRISAEAAEAAKVTVEAEGDELETAAAFPELTYTEAPLATGAVDDIRPSWNRRRDVETSGAQALADAFTLIAQIFEEGDNQLKDALDEIGDMRVIEAEIEA